MFLHFLLLASSRAFAFSFVRYATVCVCVYVCENNDHRYMGQCLSVMIMTNLLSNLQMKLKVFFSNRDRVCVCMRLVICKKINKFRFEI